jgi:hypothetical protein
MKRRWKNRSRENRLKSRRQSKPSLRFTPWAWAKFLFLRDAGETEVGGFGIANADDPLRIEDVVLVSQRTSPVRVAFDDLAVADYFDQQIDAGRRPEQFARVWLHTHPGDCAIPSATDEETFTRAFCRCDWAVMGILSRDGATYARLRFSAGPSGEIRIPVEVDFALPFAASDPESWIAEYRRCVQPKQLRDLYEDLIPEEMFARAGWGIGEMDTLEVGTRSQDFFRQPARLAH